MHGDFARLVIVGGGTAGWLSAAYLAARCPELDVTIVEAPDIPTIGVGEGSWPTLRKTLATIGIGEVEFLTACDASFKQGSRFDGWVSGGPGDSYYHPFTAPIAGDMAELLAAWKERGDDLPFSYAMNPQASICDRNLAPRQRAMPDFAGALNYGYHLDAGKLAVLLARHAVRKLGVTHVRDTVMDVETGEDGLITALRLREGESLRGDFFIDCTGMAARLIGQEIGVEWVDRSDVSFNDRALAAQVPTLPDSPIASQTVATAHKAGWLWDIALPSRRGIGCVYSSRFMDDDAAAEVLAAYVAANVPGVNPASLTPRRLQFATGHRAEFWRGNCLAVGLSAGFIEPLESSAIVLIELSLNALADNFPRSRETLVLHAARFNSLFRYRWDRTVDFLKLHYVLSARTEPYWLAQRDPATIPQSLADQLVLWRDHPPSEADFPQINEIFSAASQQYVLYGMGSILPADSEFPAGDEARSKLVEVRERERALASALPTNRAYFDALAGEPARAQGEIASQ